MAGLKADSNFSANFVSVFNFEYCGRYRPQDCLYLQAGGFCGAQVVGVGVSENTSLAAGFAASMAGDVVRTEAYDSMQKFDASKITVADGAASGVTLEQLKANIFELMDTSFWLLPA